MEGLTFDEPYYLAINEARWDAAARILAELQAAYPGALRSCLDVACGPGWFSERLGQRGLDVTGIEGRAELVAEAQRRVPAVTVRRVDVESEQQMRELGSFDLSFCFGLLYHVENPFRVIRNLERVTRHLLLIETMHYPSDAPVLQFVDEGPYSDQGLTHRAVVPSKTALVGMLRSAGFTGIFEYRGPIAHPDFVETHDTYRRRGIFVASRTPLDLPDLARLTDDPSPIFDVQKPLDSRPLEGIAPSPPPMTGWNGPTDGAADCTRLDVLRETGQPARHVSQGQTVEVFAEFRVTGEIDVPVGWFELRDASGQLIHGKSSVQHEVMTPPVVEAGRRIAYHFSVVLDVAPGEYGVVAGLSSVGREVYDLYRSGRRDNPDMPCTTERRRKRWGAYRPAPVTEEQFRRQLQYHCRLAASSTILVGFSEVGLLAHDGLVNLPGTCRVTTPEPSPHANRGLDVAPSAPDSFPTVVHLTHWKAGSQWIAQILTDCAPDRIVPSRADAGQILAWPAQPGQIFPAVYATVDELYRVTLPDDTRPFMVVRDLRDTLVSGYFSVAKTHVPNVPDMPVQRRMIAGMSMDDALLYLMDDWLSASARIQLSSIESGVPVLRYEDLIANDLRLFTTLFIHDLGLPIDEERLRDVILANRFERYSGGRRRGEEDRTHHVRKGVAGDWVNHFSDRVKRAFKARFGGLLVEMGYESDLNW